MKLRYLRRALLDLEEISRFIAKDNSTAAARVVARIKLACEVLVDFPGMGRIGRRSGTREWVVTGVPYLVVYRISTQTDTVEILRIYHGKRDAKRVKVIEDE